MNNCAPRRSRAPSQSLPRCRRLHSRDVSSAGCRARYVEIVAPLETIYDYLDNLCDRHPEVAVEAIRCCIKR